jgi:hypothetical protein
MTRQECEKIFYKYCNIVDCGGRTLFIKKGCNPIKKVNILKMNVNNYYDFIPSALYSYINLDEKHIYRGIDFIIDKKLTNDEIWVDFTFWDDVNYMGILDVGYLTIIHERM